MSYVERNEAPAATDETTQQAEATEIQLASVDEDVAGGQQQPEKITFPISEGA